MKRIGGWCITVMEVEVAGIHVHTGLDERVNSRLFEKCDAGGVRLG